MVNLPGDSRLSRSFYSRSPRVFLITSHFTFSTPPWDIRRGTTVLFQPREAQPCQCSPCECVPHEDWEGFRSWGAGKLGPLCLKGPSGPGCPSGLFCWDGCKCAPLPCLPSTRHYVYLQNHLWVSSNPAAPSDREKEEKEDNTGCDGGLSPFPAGLPPGLHLALDNPELEHEKEQVPLPHQLSRSFPLKSQCPCLLSSRRAGEHPLIPGNIRDFSLDLFALWRTSNPDDQTQPGNMEKLSPGEAGELAPGHKLCEFK